jgi:hypothetical protein
VQRSRLAQLAPLTGLVWVAAFIAAILVGGETPDDDSSTAKVVAYWIKHKSEQETTVIIVAFGILFFVWFAASLREAMITAEGGHGRLASISFGGALIFTAGVFISLSLTLAVTDTVGDVPPQVTQAVFLVGDEIFLPFIGGTFLLLAPVAILSLRTGFLPAWAGWLTLLIAVVCVTPIGFFGWVAGMLWIIPVSIVLYRRGARAAPAASV